MGLNVFIKTRCLSAFNLCWIDNIETSWSKERLHSLASASELLITFLGCFLTTTTSSSSSSSSTTFLVVLLIGFVSGGGCVSCFFFSSNLSYSAALTSISFFGKAFAFCASSFNSRFFNAAASLAFFNDSNCFSVNTRFGLVAGFISSTSVSCVSYVSLMFPSGSLAYACECKRSGSGSVSWIIFLAIIIYIIVRKKIFLNIYW